MSYGCGEKSPLSVPHKSKLITNSTCLLVEKGREREMSRVINSNIGANFITSVTERVDFSIITKY
jgi:hypothetical protein